MPCHKRNEIKRMACKSNGDSNLASASAPSDEQKYGKRERERRWRRRPSLPPFVAFSAFALLYVLNLKEGKARSFTANHLNQRTLFSIL